MSATSGVWYQAKAE
ncbi:hypothetical protein U9M48_028774 [Paspalum notatum var. saurae]|uniref:Uncharacterized protein n=1 Tax=Paspalum notatum var. saurae TaxID=547442 RepID=A0AAQ3TXY8_PASNO